MYTLTTPEKNIWNLQKFYEGTSISNNCGAIFFGHLCDHGHMNQAINKLIEIQDGMRFRFCERNGQPAQYFVDFQQETFPSMYFSSKVEFDKYAEIYAKEPFDIIDSKMYRFVIFDLDGKTGILLCINHLISDAWAISIIANSIYNLYISLVSGCAIDDKKYSFASLIKRENEYLHSPKYKKDELFWSEQYISKPELSSLKMDSQTTNVVAKWVTKMLSEKLTTAIELFCERQHIL